MFSPLRNRFGIPGVISVVALVFAMLGGAYAANNSSDGGATASAKAKKGPKGPKGATGPAGPAGAQGPAGPAGAKGNDGANGSNGSNGATGNAGAAGQSVTTAVEPPFGNCGEQEGVKLTSSSGTSYVCNGQNGQNGQSGFTETLPINKTEKGTWAVSGTEAASVFGRVPTSISFNIPLAAALDSSHVHFQGGDGFATNCTGSLVNPTATSGHLCIYEEILFGMEAPIFVAPGGAEGAGTSGTVLSFPLEGEAGAATGAWAVTG